VGRVYVPSRGVWRALRGAAVGVRERLSMKRLDNG
jgi:hypothetical protein